MTPYGTGKTQRKRKNVRQRGTHRGKKKKKRKKRGGRPDEFPSEISRPGRDAGAEFDCATQHMHGVFLIFTAGLRGL